MSQLVHQPPATGPRPAQNSIREAVRESFEKQKRRSEMKVIRREIQSCDEGLLPVLMIRVHNHTCPSGQYININVRLLYPFAFPANELFGGKNFAKAIARYVKALGHTGSNFCHTHADHNNHSRASLRTHTRGIKRIGIVDNIALAHVRISCYH